jgi:dienelactone hydrolase
VIVIHEVPGLHPGVLAFARDLAALGPDRLLPQPVRQAGQARHPRLRDRRDPQEHLRAARVQRLEGRPLQPDRRLAARLGPQAHADCGGRGVGAVGMCFTGGFALAMMTEPAVVAPVLSQPSLPLKDKGGLDCSASELACAKRRFKDEDLSLLALRFSSDKLVPDARIARLQAEFGDKVEVVELADADAAPGVPMDPHSVLTLHLHRSVPDSGSMKARDKVIAFFKQRTATP